MKRRIRFLFVATALPGLLLSLLFSVADPLSSQSVGLTVIISEVAWAGTNASSYDEWIELYNPSGESLSLDGWSLQDSSGDLQVTLSGNIGPHGFYLLERTADDTILDVPADQLYTGGLNNTGETLTLLDDHGAVVDSANGAGGEWPAGAGGPDYVSMERAAPEAADDALGWVHNDGVTRNGSDAAGEPINGTPRSANSSWSQTPPSGSAELGLDKRAPTTGVAGQSLSYQITVSNKALVTASGTLLTDTLPSGLLYAGDDSGLSPYRPGAGVVAWHLGSLPPNSQFHFHLTATVGVTVSGFVTNVARVTATYTETNPAENVVQALTHVVPDAEATVLIDSVLYDGFERFDADEAVRLRNVSAVPVSLAGWRLSDGLAEASLPVSPSLSLGAGATFWLAREGPAFRRQFGFPPDAVVEAWPGFANDGDEVILKDAEGAVVDVLVYEEGDASTAGWRGPAVTPYGAHGLFGAEGQLLYRRRYASLAMAVKDTDSEEDWAQTPTDPLGGRKVLYPGWSLDRFLLPAVTTTTGVITVAVAPDNAYDAFLRQVQGARESIQIETHTLENVALVEALQMAAQRGVSVTVLLEGAPVGGITDQEKYLCAELAPVGSQCWFMISNEEARVYDRYRYLHAKFMIIDGVRAVIGSENLSPDSLPNDDKSDGTWGRRGIALITDAMAVVERLQAIFTDDFDPGRHQDLLAWHPGHAIYGSPPPGYEPLTATGGTTYTVRYPTPRAFRGVFTFELIQAPENSLRPESTLFFLLGRASVGDTVLVQQLSERPYWGADDSDASSDPNPRLEAYLNAARRGATVRILLDAFFDDEDDPHSNTATCRYVNAAAHRERLPIRCALANPTGLGVHNKMILVEVDGQGWVHVGSLNGSEQSHKGNREVALQVSSDALYAYLAQLFWADWPHRAWLPLVMVDYLGPAGYPLISEVLYDPAGADDSEFIELANPTPGVVDLGGWLVADAVSPDDFEDARRIPDGVHLAPQTALIIALSGTGFFEEFGKWPDLEIVDTGDRVPDLIDDASWGDPAALLQLGNAGDEVILRNPDGKVVDAIAYGSGAFPGTVSCNAVTGAGHALERYPYWRDTDDCTLDFREWPLPGPGKLP